MSDFIDKIKRYFRFSKEEIKAVLISTAIIGFVLAFKDFSLFNLIAALAMVLVSIVFHVSAQKIAGLSIGFGAEYRVWWYGLLIGLAAIFITNGNVWWLVLPGGIIFSMLARHRLGKFRYGLNYFPMGIIAFVGPIASIVLGSIFMNFNLYVLTVPNPLITKIFFFNLAYAVCSMLPIPPMDGHYLFYSSRMWYSFLFGAIFAYAILVAFELYSWIWALLIGGVIWLIYYISFERGAWI